MKFRLILCLLLVAATELTFGSNMIERAEILRKNPKGFFPTAVVAFPGRVFLPNRTLLDISNSQTTGLQEAVDYAFREGYDLFVYGSPFLGQPGVFDLRRPLNLPFIQTKTIRFFQTHLRFSNEVTDYAISINSSMVVDILMTGLIDAPFANTGILFRGTKPLPLDGPIFGAIGITSSRFHFDSIIAKGPKVTFDTTAIGPAGQPSSINANAIYFAGTQPSEIKYNGHHFSKDNIFDSAGSARGYNIYIDVFDTNRVNVLPPDTSLGIPVRVFTPHGLVNTANSRTTGLQEAINTAIRYNWDLVVYGIGFSNNLHFDQNNILIAEDAAYLARGFYWLRDMLTVPQVRGRMFRMFNVNLNWTPFSGAIYNPTQQVFKGAGT